MGFFPSSFNRKYVHKVACTVVFVEPALFVFNAYPVRNANCPLSSCSNKNDGPITVNNNNNKIKFNQSLYWFASFARVLTICFSFCPSVSEMS